MKHLVGAWQGAADRAAAQQVHSACAVHAAAMPAACAMEGALVAHSPAPWVCYLLE